MEKTKIAVFASGEGTNCENIIRYFQGNDHIEVALVVSNNPEARVLVRAANLGVPTRIISRHELNNEPQSVLDALQDCSYIVLAGFLLLVPEYLVKRYHNRIVNIHPSLLPKFGGKGMWGHHVHEAVKASGDTETGITIHYVNEEMDKGEFIAQYSTPVSPDDTAEDIARNVRELELKYFPVEIEKTILDS